MSIRGAILGDIAGSQFEFSRCRDLEGCKLYTSDCGYTDDTVMPLTVKKAVKNNMDFSENFKDYNENESLKMYLDKYLWGLLNE